MYFPNYNGVIPVIIASISSRSARHPDRGPRTLGARSDVGAELSVVERLEALVGLHVVVVLEVVDARVDVTVEVQVPGLEHQNPVTHRPHRCARVAHVEDRGPLLAD